MKIVVINTRDIKGGAAIAPYRLMKKMEELYSVKVYFLVKEKQSKDENIYQLLNNKLLIFIERVIGKVFNLLGLQYLFFPFYSFQIKKKIREIKPDLIFLQNIHGGYFDIKLIKKISKKIPIVWTLHDMWAFTRNAAHTFEEEDWKYMKPIKKERKYYPTIGLNTGNLLLKVKKKIYKDSNLNIITPSNWLFNLAKQAPVFENTPIHYIPHGIEIIEKLDGEDFININKSYRTVIVVAETINNNPYKGGKLLDDILSKLDMKTQSKLNILIVGENSDFHSNMFENLIIYRLGYIKDSNNLKKLLSISDVFIHPTRAEVFGLVLLEAISVGVPCVVYDIGGCSDIITINTGKLVTPFNSNEFVKEILNILCSEKRDWYFKNCIEYAKNNFLIENITNKYYELFSEVLNNKRSIK